MKSPGPAVLGNGSLLATLSESGQVERLFWPTLDRGSHVGDLRFGLERDGETRWLGEDDAVWEQSYLDDTSVLRSSANGVEVVDLVHEHEPVLFRRITIRTPGDVRLVVHCRPELDGSTRSLAASVAGDSVVFYRRDVALAIGVRGAQAACTGFGAVEGGIALPLSGDAVVACAFGSSSREAVSRLDAALQHDFDSLLASRQAFDAERISSAAQPVSALDVAALYRRSLLALDLLADRASGSVIAAPEVDPGFERSGGYGFVWGRDLAFVLLAFLAAGRRDLARDALRWFPRAQEPEGLWLQRHWTDGSLAPSWCTHALDETGTILFAYEAAWRELGNELIDAELWDSTRLAADFLLGTIEDDGLPCATADLWEEREGRHAFTAAAIHGGLRAAASFAHRHEPALADAYEAAAEEVREAIERELWSDFHGRYLRSLGDPTPDVSLLGLAWPFAAVPPGSDRMRATVAALESELRANGGLRRYAGDENEWVLASFWLGLWHRQVGGEASLERALRYALTAQTRLGLLPERVTVSGEAASAVPHAWSHALLVLAARPELELVPSDAASLTAWV